MRRPEATDVRGAHTDRVTGMPPTRPRAGNAVSGNPVFCPRCNADVTGLPQAARYCNRCGVTLPERRSTPPVASKTAVTMGSAYPAEPDWRPVILLAYANALFNLGNRYETAVGSQRNLEEAGRCYRKAARLGNADARARVAVPCNQADSLPHGPPPLPLPGSFRASDLAPPFARVYSGDVS